MELEEAIYLLKCYNSWRLGDDIEMINPKLITEAIQVIIKEYEKNETVSL